MEDQYRRRLPEKFIVTLTMGTDIGPGQGNNKPAELIVCFLAHEGAHDGQHPGPEDSEESLVPLDQLGS